VDDDTAGREDEAVDDDEGDEEERRREDVTPELPWADDDVCEEEVEEFSGWEVERDDE
jgi:hypothetical protein